MDRVYPEGGPPSNPISRPAYEKPRVWQPWDEGGRRSPASQSRPLESDPSKELPTKLWREQRARIRLLHPLGKQDPYSSSTRQTSPGRMDVDSDSAASSEEPSTATHFPPPISSLNIQDDDDQPLDMSTKPRDYGQQRGTSKLPIRPAPLPSLPPPPLVPPHLRPAVGVGLRGTPPHSPLLGSTSRPQPNSTPPYRSSKEDRTVVKAEESSSDPVIDEHFRRSLGTAYHRVYSSSPAPPSPSPPLASSQLPPHSPGGAPIIAFPKKELLAPARRKNSDSVSSKSESDVITHSPSVERRRVVSPPSATGMSVDDHFAKALGETWTKLQQAAKASSPSPPLCRPSSTAAVASAGSPAARSESAPTHPAIVRDDVPSPSPTGMVSS
ncbi:unnamed protein product [Cyprideis torosa]|uniref:Uncharacterized protein n=1 Tax=Cyprideis torosa TaxID=163714 RepID=A0A7R8WBA2_9CRUS|nr:unnamed protein product [Cyprideis torosa]CAG0891923.1 unnamed protein product [Cyprideis torosa]